MKKWNPYSKKYDKLHRNGGSPPKLFVKDKLKIALKYLREYRTMESIGAYYEVKKTLYEMVLELFWEIY
ncbi:hypothetical protein FACS189493_6520 [Spirochaetia bacterium]|nr:hypothetical protein FACS189493_6520 [Spirochaetia bacterium]